MPSNSHTESLNELRTQCILDIRVYVDDCGETVIKNTRFVRNIMLHVIDGNLIIGPQLATATDTRTLCLIADMLNQMT
jgi:hypothetical protein